MEKSLATLEHKLLLSLLITHRESLGLRQIQVADRLGVPQSFVSKYENGERRLDVIELRSVCKALEIPLVIFIEQLEKAIADKNNNLPSSHTSVD